MRLIYATISVGLLKLAHFFANTSAAKYHVRQALEYEWELK